MSMNNKHITILTTWEDEKLTIDIEFKKWLEVKSEAKSKWEDWIFLQAYQRYIKFSNLKDERWKTQYLSLPEPKEESLSMLWSLEKKKLLENNPNKYYELERKDKERRRKIAEYVKNNNNIIELRKKNFLEKRAEILKRLAFEEKELWFDTTISKLEELENFKKQEIKNLK